MPLVGSPAVRVKIRDAKGLQELLQLEEDGVFAPSEHIGQHLPGVVIHGVPEPSRMRFRFHKIPHFVELRAEAHAAPPAHLRARFPLRLARGARTPARDDSPAASPALFLSSLMTLVGLTCSTRAVSRMPLAFITMSTIWCLMTAVCPA